MPGFSFNPKLRFDRTVNSQVFFSLPIVGNYERFINKLLPAMLPLLTTFLYSVVIQYSHNIFFLCQ